MKKLILIVLISLLVMCNSFILYSEPVEFLVNTNIAYDQREPSVAMDSDGNFVITWMSWEQDGSGFGIFAQRFDKDGNKICDEFQVNMSTEGDQFESSIGMDSDGNFVIIWEGWDGSASGVFAQVYGKDGDKIGSEFQANSYDLNWEEYPAISMGANGNFVITWIGDDYNNEDALNGIFAQLFDKEGNKIGDEFQVNTYAGDMQLFFKLTAATDSEGNFIIAWHTFYAEDFDSFESRIVAQRFDQFGIKIGDVFQANDNPDIECGYPSIAMNPDGDFIITWSADEIFAQRFDQYGDRIGDNFQVNTYTRGLQEDPAIAMDVQGNFVISWESDEQDSSEDGIFAQKFDHEGNKIEKEFRVNSYTQNKQRNPATGIDSNGNFIITWQSSFQDGHGQGIYAKLYKTEQGQIEFGLHKDPDRTAYRQDDSIRILLDIETPHDPVNADIYFVMLDPKGKVFFAMDWYQLVKPFLKNIMVPANTRITDSTLFQLYIPSLYPPVEASGTYSFAIAATEPGTTYFISNIAAVSFKVE